MYSETIEKFGESAKGKSEFLRSSLLKYFIASMMAGVYVGFGIVLIFSIGAPLKEVASPFLKMAIFSPEVFKGVYTTRELKSNTVGNKAQTNFTVAEFIQGTFLYDFVGGLLTESDY